MQLHKELVLGTYVGAQGIAPFSWCKIAVPQWVEKRYIKKFKIDIGGLYIDKKVI